MRESFAPGGRLRVILRDPPTGKVLLERRFDNLVTSDGRTLLAEMLTGASAFKGMQLAVGGPASPGAPTPEPALSDIDLHNQLVAVEVEIGATSEQEVDGQTRIVTAISGTLPAEPGGDDLAMTEAGIKVTKLDDSEVLYNRVVFPTITKQASVQMTLTWEVVF